MVKALPSSDLTQRFTVELLALLDAERGVVEVEAHPLLDELESVIAAGGKRLRPRFCYWGHLAAGGADTPELMRACASLEVLHTMAVIQDDVMDASPFRRSRAATFRTLAQLSAGVPHRGDPKRFGASAAILTGLLAFVLADRLFHTAGFPPEAHARAADRYDRMRAGAIAGQYLDLLAAFKGHADEATSRRVGQLKSGGYSVADPLAIGASLATSNASVIASLERYGRPLGEAFQIRDDVLGVFGDPAVTGKDRDGDLREGKQTVLLAKAKAMTSGQEREMLDDLVGDTNLSTEHAERIRAIIASSGALEATNTLIEELALEARNALASARFESNVAQALGELIEDVSIRDS